jgi:FixJ family two-component response regulator
MYDFPVAPRGAFSRFAVTALAILRERKKIVSISPVISVIDDDPSVRIASENLLTSLGYIGHTFASAEEFLRSPHFNGTSCVIADVQMPGMSGVELQALMLARGHRVPFIFITAFADETIRARVLKAGAVCFLTKPFDRLTLITCLNTALKGRVG